MKKCLHSALSFNGLLILLLCMHCCCCTLILWCCIYKDSFSSLFLCLRIWRRCCLSPLTPGSSCTLSCMPARRSCCSASSPPSLPTLCTTGKRRLHTQVQLLNYGSQSSGQGWNFTCLPLCRWSFRWHILTHAVVVVFHVHEKKTQWTLNKAIGFTNKNNERKIKMCPNCAGGMSSKCPEELDQWVNALSLSLAVYNDGRSHCDVSRWCAGTRSDQRKSWVLFVKRKIPYLNVWVVLEVSSYWSVTCFSTCPPAGKPTICGVLTVDTATTERPFLI